MNLYDHLSAADEPILESYTCPVTGWVGPAFAFAWVEGDDRFASDYVHGDWYLTVQREEEAALPPPAPCWSSDCEIANGFRAERRMRLSASDWTQTLDAPLSEEVKAAWAAYRQALRDLPEEYETPDLVEWPQPPQA